MRRRGRASAERGRPCRLSRRDGRGRRVEALLASGVRRVVLKRGAVSACFAIERNGLERLVRADRREAAERLSFLIQT